MFIIHPDSVLLIVPRNVVTAVGLPLACGFYSGSYTGAVVRGRWYNVRFPCHLTTRALKLTDLQSLHFPPGRPSDARVFPIVWGTLYTGMFKLKCHSRCIIGK